MRGTDGMVGFRLVFAAATAAAAIAAVPAAAVVKIATYTGTVASGYDYTGLFGPAGTNLAGASYVATYTYNKTHGGVRNGDGVNSDESYSGIDYSYQGASPIIAARITINGGFRSAYAYNTGYVFTSLSAGVRHAAADVGYDSGGYNHYELENSAYPAGALGSLDQSFGPVAVTGYGFAHFYHVQNMTSIITGDAYAEFGSDAVYSVGDVVPEPASWALLTAGFGLVGAARRRGRTIAAEAAQSTPIGAGQY